ncbi:MAG: hypothetical protein M3N52_06010 [Actinomycetota bacterium]|nr:hypothetical protein [Actinomycetota bacterium]
MRTMATYAAHLLDGSPAGRDRADEALDALVDGYGSPPDELAWRLSTAVLRRSVSPFRTDPAPDWPQRVEAMVATAEQLCPR